MFDPSITKLISIKPNSEMDDNEIVERMIFPMVNEAARCLGEKIVQSPRDIDIGMIFGTGFAPFRGGLLKYADSSGLEKLTDKLEKFSHIFGTRFTPSGELINFKKIGRFYN